MIKKHQLYKFTLLVAISLINWSYHSQILTKSFTKKHQKVNLLKSTDNWMVNIQSLEMAQPGGDSYRSFLLSQKELATKNYPRKKIVLNKKFNSIDSSIIVENGFEGNLYNNKVPNDNTLAISNEGILIAGINSSYIIYDTKKDSLLKTGTLNSIMSSYTSLRFFSKYDPKFIYDPNEDRFILVFLVGKTPVSSHVCVAFSSTNDPLGDWNVYMLVGDALNTGHWTDYPAISITEDDLFVTGNLLLNGVSWQLGFYQSIIWQIDKNTGYNGADSLSFNLWSEFKDDSIYARNIHPVRGARELQKKRQYFLSNKNFSLESDTMYLVKIEENQLSSNASASMKRMILPDHYFLSPNGQQYNGQELATNDSRVLGGIIDKYWIQFVNHSMDTSTGTCGIYHGKIYNYWSDSLVVEGNIISDTVIDYGYPNIASTAIDVNETECIIGFNYSSVVDTNGVSCIYYKDDEYSSLKKLHRGDKAIDRLSSNVERWGDYSGIQRKYDEPCKVWISGMYGKFGANGSWISSVAVSDTCRDAYQPPIIPEFIHDPSFSERNLFPNPSRELTYFDFITEKDMILKVGLYNAQGEKLNILYDGLVNEGQNRLSFNISHLSIGVYILLIKNGETILFSEKLIKK